MKQKELRHLWCFHIKKTLSARGPTLDVRIWLLDVRIWRVWRLKSIRALTALRIYNGRWSMKQKELRHLCCFHIEKTLWFLGLYETISALYVILCVFLYHARGDKWMISNAGLTLSGFCPMKTNQTQMGCALSLLPFWPLRLHLCLPHGYFRIHAWFLSWFISGCYLCFTL